MKKKNFVSLLFGTVGGILFALGMCMCLLPEWGAFTPGVVIAAVGAVVLLVLLLVRRKMAGKPAVHISGKAVGAVLLGIVGALVLGVGMCMAMVWGMLVPGIVMGVAGILLLLCMIPLVKGLKCGETYACGRNRYSGFGSPGRCGRGHYLCGEVSKTGNQKLLRRHLVWQSQSWYRQTRKSPKALWTATRR